MIVYVATLRWTGLLGLASVIHDKILVLDRNKELNKEWMEVMKNQAEDREEVKKVATEEELFCLSKAGRKIYISVKPTITLI